MHRQPNGHTSAPHQQSPLAKRSGPATVTFSNVDPYASDEDEDPIDDYFNYDETSPEEVEDLDDDDDIDNEPKEIWSSILKGVAATKAQLPIKNVIVLGLFLILILNRAITTIMMLMGGLESRRCKSRKTDNH